MPLRSVSPLYTKMDDGRESLSGERVENHCGSLPMKSKSKNKKSLTAADVRVLAAGVQAAAKQAAKDKVRVKGAKKAAKRAKRAFKKARQQAKESSRLFKKSRKALKKAEARLGETAKKSR